MQLFTELTELNVLDGIALIWFMLCWVIYTWAADSRYASQKTLNQATAIYRQVWMRQMLARDNRIVDSTLIGNLMRSVSFFASTTLIIIGSLIALLGATDQALVVLARLPLATPISATLWQIKILLLIILFVYAFFKLTWSLRQFNYCNLMIGAAPSVQSDPDFIKRYGHRAAALNLNAASQFNSGLRTYYFGLAVLAWFIHPGGFIVASTWVVVVLYWREFRSDTLAILTGLHGLDKELQ